LVELEEVVLKKNTQNCLAWPSRLDVVAVREYQLSPAVHFVQLLTLKTIAAPSPKSRLKSKILKLGKIQPITQPPPPKTTPLINTTMSAPTSPSRLAASASFRRRQQGTPPTLKTGQSFRSRAARHGIRNLPSTPRLRSPQDKSFGEGGDGDIFASKTGSTENVLYWIRVHASE
jgi:hypothetical protein